MTTLRGGGIQILLAAMLLALLSARVISAEQPQPPRVHADDNIVVEAGLTGREGEILHFGDVLTLTVRIEAVANPVRVTEPEALFFSGAWPQTNGAYLLDWHAQSATPGVTYVVYRFQILSCPEGELVCRGSRVYALPEFNLEYRMLDEAGATAHTETVSFRPWPEEIVISSAIPLTEEGELFGFYQYFPTSAWPRPLSGRDRRGAAAGLLAGGLVFLLGGIVMSPFGFFRRKAAEGSSISRWEKVYRQLQAGEFTEEDRFLDALRRCLTWYCVDELDVDPFAWLKRPEEVAGHDEEGIQALADYRTLFIELLHSPRHQGEALLDRFSSLIAQAG